MIGHNRHDVLNRIKPLITNPTIEIHAKNINPYNTINTAAYLLTTNYQNALPINDNDRRYGIFMSQWQSATELQKFLSDNPNHFAELYRILDESPGAIRGWLLAYKLHPEFDPQGRAPHTESRQQMIEQNKSEDTFNIEDILEAGKQADVCEDLVVVSSLREMLMDENGMAPQTRTIDAALREAGLKYLGRATINGKKESLWSKNPAKFGRDSATRYARVRYYLKNPL